MNKRDILKDYNLFLNKFNLKPEEFVLSSGGACVMHGVREETNDMDMAVSPEFFNSLLKLHKYGTHTFKGWFDEPQLSLEYNERIDLHRGDLSTSTTVMIEGVCCYSLDTLLRQKSKMNRNKDQSDIARLKELIEKIKKDTYQEYGSTFSSNGKEYDLNYFFQITATLPILTIDIRKLTWILKYDKDNSAEDQKRTDLSDLSVPILVTSTPEGELVVDGIHRLKKAVKRNIKTLPYRRLTKVVFDSGAMRIKEVKPSLEAEIASAPNYLKW